MMPKRAPGTGSMSWKGHDQERSVDVFVAETAAQPFGKPVKKNPCVLPAKTVRKSDMDPFRYRAHWICLYVKFSTFEYFARNESESVVERHTYNINIDPPHATLPSNAAMLHTTDKFHFSGNLLAYTWT